jgi:hypothetical protein
LRPYNAERVPTAFARHPEQPPTRLILDYSAIRGGRFGHPFRLMIPEKQLAVVHLNHNCSVRPTFDETTRSRSVLLVFNGKIHLNPMRIVAGLEQSAHLGGTNL